MKSKVFTTRRNISVIEYDLTNGVSTVFFEHDADILAEINAMGKYGPELIDVWVDRLKILKSKLNKKATVTHVPGSTVSAEYSLRSCITFPHELAK